MTRYVVGFMIEVQQGGIVDPSSRTLLQRKLRGPEAIVGRLNGPGGHVEDGETPRQAMVREWLEETGMQTGPALWDEFAVLGSEEWQVTFHRAFVPSVAFEAWRQVEDEPLTAVTISHALGTHASLRSDLVPNLTWLLPLACYTHDRYKPPFFLEL